MTTTISAASRTRRRWTSRDVSCTLAGAVALGLAVWAASTVSVPVNSDLGLVAVLPAPFWVGVVILNAAFIAALRGDVSGPARRLVMVWLICVLVIVLFGTAAFATDMPRGEVAFRHLGIADALSRSHAIDADIDAYFNWPGFFALLATLLGATGLDPVAVALWAPVVNMGLWLTAMGVLTRYLTRDPRRRWLALWLFTLGNWQDQDYLSPQAFGFFLYLVVVALVVGPLGARAPVFQGFQRAKLAAWWLGRSPAELRPEHRRSAAEPPHGHRVGALAVVLLLIAVITASHQLTPFMVVIALTALTLSGRVWPSRLPLIAAVLVAVWLVYPASAYLIGHPPLADAGLQDAAQANLIDRVTGTPGHLLVVQGRVALTVVLWALALMGAVRDWRRDRLDTRVVLLALTPLFLFPAQSYGGEMLIRVSLFALPFIAVQASSILLPSDGAQRPSFPASARLALVCVLLAVLTVGGRFGNTSYDMYTDQDVAAVAAARRLAPPGAAIISVAHPTPWRNEAYLDYRYRTFEDLCPSDFSTAVCGPLIYNYARHHGGGVVLLTRYAEASLVVRGYTSERRLRELEKWLSVQDGVEPAFTFDGARAYRIQP